MFNFEQFELLLGNVLSVVNMIAFLQPVKYVC